MVPSWQLFTDLLAALDLRPVISAQPRWLDVDLAVERTRQVSLEELCADFEVPLLRISDAVVPSDKARAVILGALTEPVPIALSGASAAQMHRLPVRPRQIDLVTSARASDVKIVLRWVRAQGMTSIDPRTLRPAQIEPSIGDVMNGGRVIAGWDGHQVEITMSTAYAASELVWMRVFDVMVPVLSITALSSTDSWTRRVLTRVQQKRGETSPGAAGH